MSNRKYNAAAEPEQNPTLRARLWTLCDLITDRLLEQLAKPGVKAHFIVAAIAWCVFHPNRSPIPR